MNNQEELTTAMHAELMEGEMSAHELSVLGVYGAIKRGVPKDDALKHYGFTCGQWLEECAKFSFDPGNL